MSARVVCGGVQHLAAASATEAQLRAQQSARDALIRELGSIALGASRADATHTRVLEGELRLVEAFALRAVETLCREKEAREAVTLDLEQARRQEAAANERAVVARATHAACLKAVLRELASAEHAAAAAAFHEMMGPLVDAHSADQTHRRASAARAAAAAAPYGDAAPTTPRTASLCLPAHDQSPIAPQKTPCDSRASCFGALSSPAHSTEYPSEPRPAACFKPAHVKSAFAAAAAARAADISSCGWPSSPRIGAAFDAFSPVHQPCKAREQSPHFAYPFFSSPGIQEERLPSQLKAPELQQLASDDQTAPSGAAGCRVAAGRALGQSMHYSSCCGLESASYSEAHGLPEQL
eukprot:6203599-Pleurochrysis_carterae.AAC.2